MHKVSSDTESEATVVTEVGSIGKSVNNGPVVKVSFFNHCIHSIHSLYSSIQLFVAASIYIYICTCDSPNRPSYSLFLNLFTYLLISINLEFSSVY